MKRSMGVTITSSHSPVQLRTEKWPKSCVPAEITQCRILFHTANGGRGTNKKRPRFQQSYSGWSKTVVDSTANFSHHISWFYLQLNQIFHFSLQKCLHDTFKGTCGMGTNCTQAPYPTYRSTRDLVVNQMWHES